MATTQFLPFATANDANVRDQTTYAAQTSTSEGYPSGILLSEDLNKALRQATVPGAALTQVIANLTNTSVNDDGNLSALITLMQSAFQAAAALQVPLGVIIPYFGKTVPAGYISANGGTIGDSSSNGTTRANADTFNLYSHIWSDFTDSEMPLKTSAGGATTRGASAAADFAAHKAITIVDVRGEHLRYADMGRGLDTGRTVASSQADALQNVTGEFGYVVPKTTNGSDWFGNGPFTPDTTSQGSISGAGSAVQGMKFDLSSASGVRTSTETRGHNIALLGILRL